jgi:hypothetical protein
MNPTKKTGVNSDGPDGLAVYDSGTWGSYQEFLDRGLLLTRKLLKQGFLLIKLKLSLQTFYGRHHDLGDRYGIYVSHETF